MTTFPFPPGTPGSYRRWTALLGWVVAPALLQVLSTSGQGHAQERVRSLLDAFDLSKDGGIQEKLPRSLEEISGLTTTSDGRVLAHNDERAVIYEVDPASGDVTKAFSAGLTGVPGDFEGIAEAEGRLFLVMSNGDLLETAEGSDGSAMSYRVYVTGLGPLCEFEGLAFDPATRSLLMPCKETRTRELRDHIVVFAVALDGMRPYPVPRVFIPFNDLDALGVKASFRPSAVEVHPETGHSVLVSAQEERILEVGPHGALVAARDLHRKTHPQPEGITFLPDGSLLLGDEGQGKRGRLTRYRPGGTPGQKLP